MKQIAWMGRLLACATFALGGALPVHSQTFPDRPITVVVAYPAGTLADLFARTLGNELGASLKQPVVVDNRPGAGQVVASTFVARAPANGHTLMVSAMPNVIAPSVAKSLPYAGNMDFAVVAHLVAVTTPLMVSSKLPANSLPEFVALVRANPGKYTFASSGIGSPIHLFAELFNREAGIKALHIPYKSYQTALGDIMTAQVDYGFMTLSAMQHVAAGKMKALGVPSTGRDQDYPALPTLEEQGMRGMDFAMNYFIVAPKGTPAGIVERLNQAINAATAAPAFAAKLRPVGGVNVLKAMTPAQATAMMAREEERWQKLVRDQGIALE